MGIEQELLSGKYPDTWQQLRLNIMLSSGWLTSQVKVFLDPFDITPKQFNILRILRGQGHKNITIQEVRERMIDKMSDASRLVDRLIKKGLIHKSSCILDKRANRVSITQKGLDLLAQIDEARNGMHNYFESLSPEEGQQLNTLLLKMRNMPPL